MLSYRLGNAMDYGGRGGGGRVVGEGAKERADDKQ